MSRACSASIQPFLPVSGASNLHTSAALASSGTPARPQLRMEAARRRWFVFVGALAARSPGKPAPCRLRHRSRATLPSTSEPSGVQRTRRMTREISNEETRTPNTPPERQYVADECRSKFRFKTHRSPPMSCENSVYMSPLGPNLPPVGTSREYPPRSAGGATGLEPGTAPACAPAVDLRGTPLRHKRASQNAEALVRRLPTNARLTPLSTQTG